MGEKERQDNNHSLVACDFSMNRYNIGFHPNQQRESTSVYKIAIDY